MTRISRRTVLAGLAAFGLPMSAKAAWPERPIVLIHGFGPGGGVDVTARILATGLSKRLGQPVVVESKPGAATTIAAGQLARAAPDGYTLALFASTYGAAAAMYRKLAFRPVDDFSTISMVAEYPYVFAINAENPVQSFSDLLKVARSSSKPLLFGTPGLGSAQHLLVEQLGQMTKIKFQHVPFRGGAQALNELLAKRIDFMVDPPTILVQQANSGKVRILAVTSAKRFSGLPNTPTVAETGVPGFDVPGWVGLVAPAGLPEPVVTKLASAVAAVLAEPEVVERFRALSDDPTPSSPGQLKARIASDISRWTSVIDLAKIARV
ncbi:MAG TPA: tripartite tricarboxylate transporter substrate binding protein [Pseudolabrys sp.]|nr:tripartite tricarboxylate transporter substrate binding protein [Pseudolabrys sp.]